ncbi:MAG TPA: phospholipase D family protein [Gemmataceae bacterium]|jgi:phosphatidylserine/phosphatidylglycerophosphate/cardiolipin synthase-like enzyme
MDWLLIATGFTGALTLLYLLRTAYHAWFTPPSLEPHFSPKGGCTDAIVREIQRARREVLVLAYSFTSKAIAQALVDAKLRGVHVDIVLDFSNEHEVYSDLHFFLEQGLTPMIDAHHAIAHNKVMIIDNRTLLTGSFNFTQHAENDNGENLLVIKGHPELIRAYKENFHAHKAHARAPEVKAAGQAGENKSTFAHAAKNAA